MNKLYRHLTSPLILAAFAMASLLHGDPDRLVESLIAGGKFEEAQPVIEQRLKQSPDDAYLQYNLALTHYARGNYEEAVVLWEKVRLSPDKDLVTKAMAQIGNASYRISLQVGEEGRKEDETIQLRRALHSLQAAVERDKRYEIARKNHDYVAEKMAQHLVQQGNSKIERTEVHWIKGERELVLFRSALTDFEEALSIKPKDEEIQKLVEETRQKMTDYLTQAGERNLSAAEKKLEKVIAATTDKKLGRDDGRELQRAEDEISEAVANFEDAMSISPEDQDTREAAEKAREKASQLMEKVADLWRENSEAYEQSAEEKQARRNEIAQQLANQPDPKLQNQLKKESSDLAKEIPRDQQQAQLQAEKALEDYERALDYDPENQQALAALQQLKQKMSEQWEAEADQDLEVANNSQESLDRNQAQLAELQQQLENADDKKAEQIESRIDVLEQQNAAVAQRAADELLNAKAHLEQATQLDPENQSAAEKLAETNERIADVLEQAGDLQLAAAEQLQQKGQEDQAIARMEQAIKDFDSAIALSQQAAQQEAISQKMESARQELLSQRNERAQELNAQLQQQMQQQQAAANQPPPQNAEGQPPETAFEYIEMVQFAEEGGSEQFGKFDTQAMKSVVKDW